MPINTLTPGVYIEEVSTFPPSVAPVSTAVPAFVGNTEKGPLNTPTRIQTLFEFEQIFGGAFPEVFNVNLDTGVVSISGPFPGKFLLYYSLQLYFSNGGGPCWIVSAGSYTAAPVKASLKTALDTLAAIDEPTLLVCPEAVSLTAADCYALNNDMLAQASTLGDRFAIIDVHGGAGDAFAPAATIVSAFRGAVNSSAYGAAYYPFVKTSLSAKYALATTMVVKNQTTLVATPVAMSGLGSQDLNDAKAAIAAYQMVLPPSGGLAGAYATVDSQSGVWKAPANITLANVVAPAVIFNDKEQEGLNVDGVSGKSINAIRFFSGRGVFVWGARTLKGNDGEYKYIPVRRFVNMVEESVKNATMQLVFEPNDANTWMRAKSMVESFLMLQWRAGALQGASPKNAYFVHCGLGTTMTAQDVLNGKMIIQVGMAIVRPAEFVVLQFSHKMVS